MQLFRRPYFFIACLFLVASFGCRINSSGGENEKPEAPKVEKKNDGAIAAAGSTEGENSLTVDHASSLVSPALGVVSGLNPTVLSTSRQLVHEVEVLNRTLSSTETARAIQSIQDARDAVAGRGPTSTLLCFPSSSVPGKACMKDYVKNDNLCIGNYFDSVPLCKQSLSTSRSGRACYQSSSSPGKALISLIASTSGLIGNYYSNFNNCTTAMASAFGSLVCMESARYAGKWFIANLDKNAEQVGGYFASFADCKATF